jgi:DNA-binding LacI/PurR family transcriptional regulator
VPISKTLRRKVHAEIRQLDYHPDYVAGSLKTRRPRALGITVPDMLI